MLTTSLLVLLPYRMSGSPGWAGVSVKSFPSSISVLFKSFGHFRVVLVFFLNKSDPNEVLFETVLPAFST